MLPPKTVQESAKRSADFVEQQPGRKVKQEQEEVSPNHVPRLFLGSVQSSEKRLVRGLVKFVPALACLFCLALLGTCLVESAYLISEPCTEAEIKVCTWLREISAWPCVAVA